ncbi:MAG TPA: hypothetical protein VFQ23_12050 [Anaerolineales bacterium]|nr:hypothetical protein [Anaerolineales bacterium]
MTQPVSNQNEPSKLKQLLNGGVDESIKSRLPRAEGMRAAPPEPIAIPVEETESTPAAEPEPKRRQFKFLPAFWTIASVMSFTVNIVMLIVVLVLLQMLGTIQFTAGDQISGLLGGLYNNFVKMDEASIRTSIHVEKEIPVNFTLNVSGPTNVTLSSDVTIDGALVTVQTGGLNIVNARARIVLPAGSLLPINIENLAVPVDQKVLAVLDVPVDIPLNQTELHEPFVGLQQVVKPWYCLIQPNALLNNVQVCR